jgi:hypothetical protein
VAGVSGLRIIEYGKCSALGQTFQLPSSGLMSLGGSEIFRGVP